MHLLKKENLEPCPHCGGRAELEDWLVGYESGTTIECVECGACVSESVVTGNGWHERAIKKWNRRLQVNTDSNLDAICQLCQADEQDALHIRFPLIKVVDNDAPEEGMHIFGTNPHDLLEIDSESGGLQYLNLHCGESTQKLDGKSTFSFTGLDDESLGPYVEMVSFKELCEIYLEQTKQWHANETALRKSMETFLANFLDNS